MVLILDVRLCGGFDDFDLLPCFRVHFEHQVDDLLIVVDVMLEGASVHGDELNIRTWP